MKKHTAKDAVKIIIATAKDYNRLLENKNFIFIYRNRLKIKLNILKLFSYLVISNIYVALIILTRIMEK